MDQQLKQRLIGVTIFFTLVIIFVPMLFEKSDDKGRLTSGEVPSIPEDVLEKPLELPKTAEDLAPKEEAEKAKVESGYHIVPFNEEPPKPKEGADAKKTSEGGEAASGEEGTDEAGVKKAGHEGSLATPAKPEKPKATAEAKPKSKLAEPKQEIPVEVDAEEEPPVATSATTPAPVAKSASKPEAAPKKAQPTHPAETAMREAETPTAAVKTEKAKPKPVSSPILDEEEHGASAEKTPPSAKPKPQVTAKPTELPAKETAKKPEPPKPAPAPKPEKSEPTATGQPPSQPLATSKPAAKPVEPAKAKAPTSWVIQAGSFTDEFGAKALAEKLKQAKFPAYVEAVTGSHGQIYRVQVGPESELRKAQETLKQIGTNVGINGFIAPRH